VSVEKNCTTETLKPDRRSGLRTFRDNAEAGVDPVSFSASNSLEVKENSVVKKRRYQRQKQLVDRLLLALGDLPDDAVKTKFNYRFVADKVARCGNVRLPETDPLIMKAASGNRYVGSVVHCGKAVCPSCLPYHDRLRAEVLNKVAVSIAEMEVRTFMMTVTMRHRVGAKFRNLIAVFKRVWRKMTSCALWKKCVLGFAWKMETTYGKNGHHPHKHCLVTLREGVDGNEFSAKVKEYWERELAKQGRSCDWKDGWWEVVDLKVNKGTSKMMGREEAVYYLFKSIKEVTGASTKPKAPWLLPPNAYVEVYLNSRGVRWFGVGGCWRTVSTVNCESELSLELERELEGEVLLRIPGRGWDKLSMEERFWVRSIVADKEIDDGECVEMIVELMGKVLKLWKVSD